MKMNLKIYLFATIFLAAVLATPVLAYVMSSTSYKIERDSINFAGGQSTSTTYKNESTIGEIGTGTSTSAIYKANAGYQQMDGSWVSLSISGNTALTSNINTLTGGTADGSAILTVRTNNAAGYTLQLKAATSPALKSTGGSFTDYATIGADPDYDFITVATSDLFAFTPEGADIVTRYKDDGASSCNQALGSDTTSKCWEGLSLSDRIIAQSAVSSTLVGINTTVKFHAAAGSSASVPAGSYSAAVTVTAFTN